MIGTTTAVFCRTASKFRKSHGQYLVVFTVGGEIRLKGCHRIRQLPQQASVIVQLPYMGVVASLRGKIEAGFGIGMNQCGNAQEGIAERRLGVRDCGLIARDDRFNPSLRDVGIQHCLL